MSAYPCHTANAPSGSLRSLANSNRSVPLSVSRAQNRKPFSFCTREPTGTYWPRIRGLLEGDTLKRGQALALGGVEALLSNLHPKASYSGGVLALDKTCEPLIEPAGRGITLVPCVFAWPRVMMLVQPGYRPTLAYGPRGVANLWSSSSPASNGTALEAALSAVRASVLKGLFPMPTTTTELAHQLHLSPAAVSAHLSRLKAAELVESHRSGKRVYYRLSYAGESLLGIFGELE
jgi:DNA-binding transcriptional ArsR family regulator